MAQLNQETQNHGRKIVRYVKDLRKSSDKEVGSNNSIFDTVL